MRCKVQMPAFATVLGVLILSSGSASAQQTSSHLFDITKSHTLKVCALTDYYAISYRDPKVDKLVGLDADMAALLASYLGADLKVVETSFSTFTADLQSNKCDVAMSGFGITMKRAQAVEFSEPYLVTDIVAITRSGGKVVSWEDIDKPGVRVAVLLGSYIEPFIRSYLKNAIVVTVQPPASREGELMARRADVAVADFPTALKVRETFDWATIITPKTKLSVTPFGYAVNPGDQIWLNYINLFVQTIKRNGKLAEAATAAHLDPILAP